MATGSSITGPRERAKFCQSLAPLIRGLEGREVIVELKNEIVLYGKLIAVDCFMNLTLENIKMIRRNGDESHFQFFFVQGTKSLRYLRIPDDVDIRETLKSQLDLVSGRKAKEERRRGKEKRANWLRKKEAQTNARD